jgi:hypothetical protein
MNYRLNLFAVTLVFLVVLSAHLVPNSASAQIYKITDLSIDVDLQNYSGRCPAEIRVKGQLRADGPLGVVRYQVVHSDGTQSAVSQLTINNKGQFTFEETLRKNASWNDTVYLRVLSPVPQDSNRITIKGECQTLRTVPRQESISLGPASGRFRVTLNGFTCNHQTAELNNPLLRDGADDEVYLSTKSFAVEKRADGSGVNVSPPAQRETLEIGDTSLRGESAFPSRIQGGSGRYMGGNGGFRAGDSFPSSPEKHSTNPQARALPQLIWEGELTRRQNAMVIIPTIWESDGVLEIFQVWARLSLYQFSGVGELISDPNRTDQESAKVSLREEVAGRIVLLLRGDQFPLDYPIGMRFIGGDYSNYAFRPEVLILTYDEALRMAQSQRNNGKATPIVYADAPELGGNYELHP